MELGNLADEIVAIAGGSVAAGRRRFILRSA